MADEILVDKKLEDGEKLIRALRAKNFDVSAAFWMQIDDGFWHLYIASKNFETETPGSFSSWDTILATLGQLGHSSIDRTDLTLITTNSPAASEVIELQSRFPLNLYSRQQLRKLGGLRFAEAHIYPPASAA